MTTQNKQYVFWNIPTIENENIRATILTTEKDDNEGLEPDMYHIILYELKDEDVPPKKTIDIVCKLLDPNTYIKNLLQSMTGVMGTIFCKTSNSLQYHDEFLEEVKYLTDSTWS